MKKEQEDSRQRSEKALVADICFGLDRVTDEQSLRIFLEKCAEDAVLDVIVPRLSDDELSGIVDFLTGVLHRHLSKKEYHRLFLEEGARRD